MRHLEQNKKWLLFTDPVLHLDVLQEFKAQHVSVKVEAAKTCAAHSECELQNEERVRSVLAVIKLCG